MISWLTSHLGDLLIGAILIVIVFVIIRHLLKQRKLGPCAGCSCAAKPNNCGLDPNGCVYQDLSIEELQAILEQQDFSKDQS